MRKAARAIKGTHDFKPFQSAAQRSRIKNTVRTIKNLSIVKEGDLVHITITADGFLYKMVRNITGALIAAGNGRDTPKNSSEPRSVFNVSPIIRRSNNMSGQMGSKDQRGQPRVSVDFPATVSVGSQLTVKGQIKDISINSAFITIKNNIYLNINDEVGITIQCSPDDPKDLIQGMARISRIVPGEGFAVYFTKIDDNSVKSIKKLLLKPSVP